MQISRVPYLPGLDGLRALAVVVVMIYHANVDWLPGGFLGVEVFFVISGYLITLLLISEKEKRGASTSPTSGCGGLGASCRRCS
jgi:peptidoglycan/LPS O-acetylase OafA/YrhL